MQMVIKPWCRYFTGKFIRAWPAITLHAPDMNEKLWDKKRKLELHGESLLKDYMDVELWVCPWCGRIAFFMREKDRKDRYRAECGGRTDEELSALLESPDAPALLRDAAREVLDSRAEWKAAEQRRRAKETEREQESTPRGGFFSGLFGGRDDDKPRKNQPPEF